MKRPAPSLRARAQLAVAAVALVPLALVGFAHLLGQRELANMRESTEEASTGTVRAITESETPRGAAERAAARSGVRVRVVDTRTGATIAQGDHEAELSVRDRIGDAIFGPRGAPTLPDFDAGRGAANTWPEVEAARRDGSAAGCEVVLGGALSVCHAAHRVPGTELVVVSQKSSPRAIRALFDQRWALLKLTGYTLVTSLLLAAWLARRILKPIEDLDAEIRARLADPERAAPLPRVSRDEIGDLGQTFEALVATLIARGRANEAFAADLAHELKSPIAALRAMTDSLEGSISAERAERLHRIASESTTRLDQVVSEVLALARAEAGLVGEERAPLDLEELARGLVHSLAEDARFEGVAFEVSAPEAPVRVQAAHLALERAARNVLENAAAFAGRGGTVSVRVSVRVLEGGEGAQLVVRDTGPGIAAENLARVFDRFYTDRPDGRGTGLGLAFTKAVVEAHGGAIEAESTPGEGATFTLSLPRAP
ncbi:MAG: HAMP domain-containing sensor histidine kinase [Polyangiaceae bacterium]